MDVLAKSILLAAMIDHYFRQWFLSRCERGSHDRWQQGHGIGFVCKVQSGGIKLPANCFILVGLLIVHTSV